MLKVYFDGTAAASFFGGTQGPRPSITCKSMRRTSYTPRRMPKSRRRWWRPTAQASRSRRRICSTWRAQKLLEIGEPASLRAE